LRHVVTITFEDGRTAAVIVDEDNEVSVRGLRNVRGVTYAGVDHLTEPPEDGLVEKSAFTTYTQRYANVDWRGVVPRVDRPEFS
jgi:hypothetical protein